MTPLIICNILNLHTSNSRLSWKLCGKSCSLFWCAAIRSGGNEVRNVLKFCNGKFAAAKFLRSLRNYSGKLQRQFLFHVDGTFPSLFLFRLIDGSSSAGRKEKCWRVVVEKIMKIGLLWALRNGIQVVITFPFYNGGRSFLINICMQKRRKLL